MDFENEIILNKGPKLKMNLKMDRHNAVCGSQKASSLQLTQQNPGLMALWILGNLTYWLI